MDKITEPGIYHDVPIEVYHGEPCAEPSISSSGLRKLEQECPQTFRYWKDNPTEPTDDMAFGSAAHEWLLERSTFFERWGVLPEDWNGRTKAGKADKSDIEEEGKRVLTFEKFENIKQMIEGIERHEFAGAAFRNGVVEPTLIWKHEATGIWLRCRPDFLPNRPNAGAWIVADYKTTKSARKKDFEWDLAKLGYHQQAALYVDGIEALTGHRPHAFTFVAQEKKPPFVISVFDIDPEDIDRGRELNELQVRVFADCISSDTWPGYFTDIKRLSLPYSAYVDHQERKAMGEFDFYPSDEEEAA